ncbi:MAG: hypothetical protein M1817_004187 [Caeruleum heppii]|nr:MAG: hypothetical protein M1817_004187 [Caeruleum heppii]
MRTTLISLAAVSLLQLAAAQPHGRHIALHGKRDVVEYQTVTAAGPKVLVYVDENGNPTATSTVGGPEQTQVQPPTGNPAVPVEQPPAPTNPAPYVPAPDSSSGEDSSPPVGSSGGSSGKGITYSPYNGDHSCKNKGQVEADLAKINGYSILRLYGIDCSQLETVVPAAQAKGMKVMAGVFNHATVETDINMMIETVKLKLGNDWSSFDAVAIGNEWVNGRKTDAATVVASLNLARPLLRAAGFQGPVVAPDTVPAIKQNPSICQNSDFVAANCHAFFDGGKAANEAGAFVHKQYEDLRQLCGKDRVVITETGWPSQGERNGAAQPGSDEQKTAIESIETAFKGEESDFILFTAFNDMWKQNFPGSFDAEQYWGIL